MDIVLADPAVAGLGSSVGGGGGPGGASVNRGRLFISLKPLAERGNVSTQQVIARLRATAQSTSPGIRVFMVPAQDLRVGGRSEQLAISVHAVEPGYRPVCRPGCRACQTA